MKMTDEQIATFKRLAESRSRVCRACHGNGWTWESPRMPVVGRDEEYKKDCPHCNASGVLAEPDTQTLALITEIEHLRAAVDFAGRWMVDDLTPDGMAAYATLLGMIDGEGGKP